MTIRLDEGIEDDLRLYRVFTGKAASGVINDLLRGFFAEDGEGRQGIERGMTDRAKKMHGPALDELAERRSLG
jgi:hypothetical protein